MKTVLLAIDSHHMTEALTKALEGQYTVISCTDGFEAVDALQTVRPHMMIVDLMLTRLEGLRVVQAAWDMGLRIPTVVITGYISEYITYSLEQMKVGRLLRLPCDPLHIAAALRELEAYGAEDTREERRIRELLGMLGLRLNSAGYPIATECIKLLLDNPRLKLTTELYPMVADRLHGTSTQVEKSLRHCVESAWAQCNQAVWRIYFPVGNKNKVNRPTNAQFLYRMVEVILQEREVSATDIPQSKFG